MPDGSARGADDPARMPDDPRLWLAIDTSTDTAGLALHDGGRVTDEVLWTAPRRHTGRVASELEALLGRAGVGIADVGAVAVAIGPGSYTGLRVGLALAKGIALGRGIPVVGVPTLDVVAAPWSAPHAARGVPLWAVLDAGRGRLAVACYPPGDGTGEAAGCGSDEPTLGAPLLVTEDQLAAQGPAWVVGELAASGRARLAAAGWTVLPPAAGRRAGWLAEVGRRRYASGASVPLSALVPIYLDPGAAPP